MIAVQNQAGIAQLRGGVQIAQTGQIFVVVVGVGDAVLVHIAPQDGVGQGIAGALYLPVAVAEGVGVLSRVNGVHHYGEIAAGGILHTHGNIKTAGGQPVLLVFHRPGSHCHIGKEVV